MVMFHSFLYVYQRVQIIKTIMMSIMMVPAPTENSSKQCAATIMNITCPLDAIGASSPSSVGYNCVYMNVCVCAGKRKIILLIYIYIVLSQLYIYIYICVVIIVTTQ